MTDIQRLACSNEIKRINTAAQTFESVAPLQAARLRRMALELEEFLRNPRRAIWGAQLNG